MRRVGIVSALRTPIGTFGGTLKDVSASTLGAVVIRELLKCSNLSPEQADEVILGNVLQAGQGQNPARQAAIAAALPVNVPSYTVNKVCGSGLKAVHLAFQSIALGEADIVIAGGMESMSGAPYLLKNARWGCRMGNQTAADAMINDGLWDAFGDYHMGITAENLAERFGISREEQDEFAARSQQKAQRAIAEGRIAPELVCVTIPQKKGEPVVFDKDEYPRQDVTAEKLAGLRPAFIPNGTVTAGNSSGVNDGAAGVLLMSDEKIEEMGLKPMAWIRGFASAGVDPSIMGIGPVAATQRVLKQVGMSIQDIDLIEANEAFAAQALAVGCELKWDPDNVNVNGGAIAYGHPIGASGAKIMVSLLHEMARRQSRFGLATLCIGGGMGIAAVVERQV